MQKIVKILDVSKIFTGKKIKKDTKDKYIYDKKYKIAFITEKDRREFINHIERAEEDIKRGRVFTQKEMDDYYKEQFGFTA